MKDLESEEIPLLYNLKKYSMKDISCFDVPGHVKNQGVKILNNYFGEDLMSMDINSSPRMDNVANPKSIIKESQELLAKAYKSDKAFFITNGTTGAIQIMILSTINPGDKVLLPRNIHKSVINALILSGGEPVFIDPEFSSELGISLNVDANKIKKALDEVNDIKAVFLLNPTYYGACCDLEEIIKVCKEKNILVLIDEAHGAHFPFNEELPTSAMELGAHMSAVSMHKSGGALTQASILLINKDIDGDKIQQTINMLQSTSASYLLMASIDGARHNLVKNGQSQLLNAIKLARYAKSRLNKINNIKVLSKELLKNKGVDYIDETKLCINVSNLSLTGYEVYDLLYKGFDIQVELGDINNVLALISLGTTKEDVDKLINSIEIIALISSKNVSKGTVKIKQINPIIRLNPREAFYSKKESINIEDCVNRISGESIMAYPPGIPVVAPGELITKEIIDYIKLLKDSNAYLCDMKDKTLETILVIS
ncbi:aminotransferase class I/II-fold pyridoxal phosphate-dependent enzyme [[Clostridium] dakarense]|uniref:aminotransferase class I/II-fold pyridoxal phosphate-dependent enzyme n=1 Tax=Faecalimicrobium dakarense TaxID=1301100 RepID=UPI0004B11078|nr:aminotransferase class I/II-fold pyridoxal phosphate-dependent enzyme [[Clostridium] dakarense]